MSNNKQSMKLYTEEQVNRLKYWKNNAEEDYLTTPISVLKYISELEKLAPIIDKELKIGSLAFIDRAKWMRDKIKGNNEQQ